MTPRGVSAGAEAADAKAVRVTVSGAVQGVGFRETTRRRALKLGVLGWVRNTDEGTVAAHAEGRGDAVDELVAFLRAGHKVRQWPT